MRELLDGAFAMSMRALTGTASMLGGVPGDDPDEWDPEYIRRTLPLLDATFGNYFRGEVRGLGNIPRGPSLLVGNHSGGTYIADTFIFSVCFYKHFGPYRRFHQLAHDLAVRGPLGGLIRSYGTLAASHENAAKAFDRRAPVLVYPGGDYETFRPSWHSDQIEFGGRKGFIRLALESGVPIVPVVALGGQETALFVTRGERLARATGWANLTRIKVLPVALAPPFGISVLDLPPRLPLPSKITVEVLPPIDLERRFERDVDHAEVYEAITGKMQDALSELQDKRSIPVVG